ncbi:MAG: hypothetical protein GY806_11885 [Gammaproteobacteria bacterium]|nr:hypothetical protein [Gammaproteobacteria bacterium]
MLSQSKASTATQFIQSILFMPGSGFEYDSKEKTQGATTIILRLRKLLPVFLILLSPYSISAALADKPVDLHLVGGMSVGYSIFDLPAKLDHRLTFPVYQVNAAIAYKKFYAVLNLADSISDADVSEEEDVGKATRYDRDLSLGYQVTASWGIFAGYKTGETEIDYLTREELDEGVTAFSRNDSYLQKGPFIGVSYSKKFSRAGKLNLSLAYAELNASNTFDADVETDGDDEDDELEFDDLSGTVKGNSTGLSYGIRWSIAVSGNLLYYLSYKVNDYKQDVTFNGNRFNNIDETLDYFTTGIVYVY